ncbi:unnamed protein product [Ilex paraguariensis]|uniref:Uncharacterized protein n=1 Tax=Ilex paraguariensis TaxID=185542 RepID=A0ABC8RH67_9AQUA
MVPFRLTFGRRTILNYVAAYGASQQRVFAVQVFELHRLIKVQRLIAGAPHLLLEENAYLGKPVRGSPAKKIPLEYILKAPANTAKHKEDFEKPNYKMECSAENAVGKTSLSSVQNGSKPPNHRSFLENPPLNDTTDAKSPCSFHQPPGHQWLIPVMSPSEGLVYKPYPGPGFMGPGCGGCGPPGSTPIMGNFLSPACGLPTSHHHYQGMGIPPFASTAGHSYLYPYGMPFMNPSLSGSSVEKMNHFTGPVLHGQLSGAGANFNSQNQSSYNLPSQKNGAFSNVAKLHAHKDSELQFSTASSPSEKAQGMRKGHTSEGRNVLPLFPASPAVNIPDGPPQLHESAQPAQVIRVVPHNARSANESAARIFQSIQEERKHLDSI